MRVVRLEEGRVEKKLTRGRDQGQRAAGERLEDPVQWVRWSRCYTDQVSSSRCAVVNGMMERVVE
jgi:hypothetical protein